MIEKDFQGIFNKWARANIDQLSTGAYELKICKSKSIRFDAVADHQKEALMQVSGDGHYYKINDAPFIPNNPKMRFTQKKPYDCFLMRGKAYVVILWYVPRQKKVAYFVEIQDWLKAEAESSKKSIRESEVKKLAVKEIETWPK